MKPYLLCAAVLALGACATQPAPLGPAIPDEPAGPALSAPDVQALVVGNTGTGTMSGSNATYAMYVMPGGRAELKRPTGIEDGNWQITPDGKFVREVGAGSAAARITSQRVRIRTARSTSSAMRIRSSF